MDLSSRNLLRSSNSLHRGSDEGHTCPASRDSKLEPVESLSISAGRGGSENRRATDDGGRCGNTRLVMPSLESTVSLRAYRDIGRPLASCEYYSFSSGAATLAVSSGEVDIADAASSAVKRYEKATKLRGR